MKSILSASAVDEFIQDILREWKSPGGLSIALVRRDDSGAWTVETKGYGTAKSDGTKVDENTLFAIASNSKLVTAIATGILISDETLSPRLSWNSKIHTILPEWKLQDPIASSETTIVDMLSHRTGLPRHENVYALDDTRASLLEKMKHLRPSSEFRETQQYNNLMYMTVSYLPEVLYGKPFPQFVQEKIFNPLGMNATSYATNRPALADGFKKDHSTRREDDVFGGTPRAMPHAAPSSGEANSIRLGPGGVITSAADMAIWLQVLLLEGSHPLTGEQIIPREVIKKVSSSITAVTAPIQYPEFSPSVYGAGLFTKSYRGHCTLGLSARLDLSLTCNSPSINRGDNPGFTAVVSRFPNDNLGIAVLSNDGDMGSYIMEIIKYHLVDTILGLETIDWNTRYKEEVISSFNSQKEARKFISEPRISPSIPFSQLAEGKYNNPAYGTLTFSLATQKVEELPDLTEIDMPFLWARWDRVWTTHIVLTHMERDTFKVLLPRSLPTNDSSKPYWMNYEITGKDMTAEFVIRDGIAVGFALDGNFWGASGVGKPQGSSIKERAEVWFDRC
ncbi:hypothetical protein GYMLUDRAFT_55999 [Collybiopsis luxurians FD-317 M1]|nr:hypothetical protein GYMLUDRAFT_55999 [Collybiopsis luxurians FD-317 M1]